MKRSRQRALFAFGEFTDGVTFYVDAADSETCTG